ncbi:hypothetical protein KBY66_14825 [Synechococcus sp. Tobar12-5m-g]|uniref:hypothetical protein n=1 Tax=unclassified Synechococcus TaxID=2626047 RepID=UPI0020CE7182|nr:MULTISPECIES: hypothetical protein [unclassified Synechococcus]MCP9773864.1 hypothetical protein [Synechococcus sp. Tobar12-5m-g]MCP9874864.1 hypothetical protein [Synechococcus sp. Cruz CV-v-12]
MSRASLIGFRYPFSSKPDISINGCTGKQFLVSESTVSQFTPYVKFISIKVGGNGLPRDFAGLSYTKSFDDGSPYQLRSSEDRPSGSKGNSDQLTLELPTQLDPGSNLIIPVEFGFQYVPSRDQLKPKPWSNPVFILDLNVDPQTSQNMYRGINSKDLKELRLKPGFVGMMKNRSDEIPISHQITVGQVIDHIEIAKESRLKPLDVAFITIGQMVRLGSCPYLVVYDRTNGYWVDYGTVLVARNTKSLQTEETYLYTRNISQIMIQEREDEITYLDQVRLTFTDPGTGVKGEVTPPDTALANADQEYMVLRKGESWQFDFSSLLPDGVTDLEVRINGYYQVVKPE